MISAVSLALFNRPTICADASRDAPATRYKLVRTAMHSGSLAAVKWVATICPEMDFT